jgi:TolA-binding protein
MLKSSTNRNRFLVVAVFAFIAFSAPRRAQAASKEIIELQTQVQQLTDMVQRLQSTLDTKFGILQHLVEQTADNTNQMTVAVTTLQQKINAQTEAGSGKLDTVSGQVQSLNDSVDELKSRIAKLDKSVQDMQAQLQNIQTPPAGAGPTTQSPAQFTPPANSQQASPSSRAAAPAQESLNSTQAPPLEGTFQAGVRDYNAARYEVAAAEFQDVLHFYPMDEMAGQAQFYLGEIAYRQLNYADAVKAFNAVLESFPGSTKAPAAQLRKGFALLQLNRKDAGINELRLLIKRHPQTPEAAQARSKLNAMSVRITPAAPSSR